MARVALNWTVRDLAEATCLHRNTITNIETGRYVGDSATLGKIATVLTRVQFIDENGGGPGVRLRKRHQKKSRPPEWIWSDRLWHMIEPRPNWLIR
jgi:transcriptional regulator with XRE-family HTH domain